MSNVFRRWIFSVVAVLVVVATFVATPAPSASAAKPGSSTTTTTEASSGELTAESLERNGPYAFASYTVTDAQTPGFGAATIYHPTATGTYGGVSISPGFTEKQSAVSWFGPRLSSHGFVVITFDTNSGLDYPDKRATQLLAALDYLTGESAVRDKVDPARLAVMGHSMGGGGAIEATSRRTSLKASVPLTPWHGTKDWPGVVTPSGIIGAQDDTVAPVATHAIPLYEGLTNAREKAYMELAGASHSVTNSDNPLTSRFTVAWLKRFVNDDTAYDQFLCPPPVDSRISQYRSTCPH